MKTVVRAMKDHELLLSTENLAQTERGVKTEMLRHLAEIERRKLYADLKYPSLFEYAVGELGYSNSSASRRIQAMRLMKEIPEVEAKIESGALTLSNISQAQIFFRDLKRAESVRVARDEPTRGVTREEKSAVLAKLEHKSSREAERVLLAMSPAGALPRERVRQIDLEHTELRFVVSAELKAKLQEVRSLMGPRGGSLSLSELVEEMATVAAQHFAEKKFGKKRVQAESTAAATTFNVESRPMPTVTSGAGTARAPKPHPRYIPQSAKHAVWRAARGQCAACGAQHNLQIDHIRPAALGGASTPDNLQLLCGSCNLRRGVKTFGAAAMCR